MGSIRTTATWLAMLVAIPAPVLGGTIYHSVHHTENEQSPLTDAMVGGADFADLADRLAVASDLGGPDWIPTAIAQGFSDVLAAQLLEWDAMFLVAQAGDGLWLSGERPGGGIMLLRWESTDPDFSSGTTRDAVDGFAGGGGPGGTGQVGSGGGGLGGVNRPFAGRGPSPDQGAFSVGGVPLEVSGASDFVVAPRGPSLLPGGFYIDDRGSGARPGLEEPATPPLFDAIEPLTTAVIPEPSSLTIFLVALGGLVIGRAIRWRSLRWTTG